MKTEYARDNTASSIIVVLSFALAVALIAALIGLSDKPDVESIGLAVGGEGTPQATLAPAFNFDDAAGEADDDSGASLDASPDASSPAQNQAESQAESQAGPEQTIIVVPTLAPEPTPTAAVAAAVEPATEQQATEAIQGDVQPAPSLPTSSGSVQGTFFTAGVENDGAVVAQNLITISFAEDGSGSFQGVLDITYADTTHVLLNMSGPLMWGPTNPQVEAVLAGAFTLDAPVDADDVVSDDAELSISSLQAGSGSLCTTKCFGFTFPLSRRQKHPHTGGK